MRIDFSASERSSLGIEWELELVDLDTGELSAGADEILTELGARRIGERHMHDASSGILPEETALEWCQEWLAKARETQTA